MAYNYVHAVTEMLNWNVTQVGDSPNIVFFLSDELDILSSSQRDVHVKKYGMQNMDAEVEGLYKALTSCIDRECMRDDLSPENITALSKADMILAALIRSCNLDSALHLGMNGKGMEDMNDAQKRSEKERNSAAIKNFQKSASDLKILRVIMNKFCDAMSINVMQHQLG